MLFSVLDFRTRWIHSKMLLRECFIYLLILLIIIIQFRELYNSLGFFLILGLLYTKRIILQKLLKTPRELLLMWIVTINIYRYIQ